MLTSRLLVRLDSHLVLRFLFHLLQGILEQVDIGMVLVQHLLKRSDHLKLQSSTLSIKLGLLL